ncbi:MAG: TonB-dependent receptor [Sphingomonas sp.]
MTAAFNPATTSLGFINAGNTDLTAEKARTWTLGAVLTPGFVPSLLVSVDYFKIDIDDGHHHARRPDSGRSMRQHRPRRVLQPDHARSHQRADPDRQRTPGQRRVGADGGDRLLASATACRSTRSALPGALRFDANHSWLLEYQTQPFAGVAFDDTIKGEPAYPAHKTNLRLMYTKGPLNVTVSERIIGRTYRIVGLDFAGNAVPAYWYTGVVVRYNLTKQAQGLCRGGQPHRRAAAVLPRALYIGSITSTNTAAGGSTTSPGGSSTAASGCGSDGQFPSAYRGRPAGRGAWRPPASHAFCGHRASIRPNPGAAAGQIPLSRATLERWATR